MASKNIEGIILSRISFGEADRILTVFSKDEGKVKILAKGSRRIKSKLAPHIEPFTVGNYFVTEGRSFYILTGAEATEQNEGILSELEIYKDACYVSELLAMTLFEGVKNANLYRISKEVFLNLPKYQAAEREVILHFFEYKLLESAGYVPNFHHCVKCGKKLEELDMYEGTFEGVKCGECTTQEKKVSKTFVKIIRFFANNELESVLKLSGLEKFNGELRDVLLPFLYDILPRTPRARNL